MPEPVFGFIGAGRMATALASGMVEAGVALGERIVASDPVDEVRRSFQQANPAARVIDDNRGVVAEADVVVLAVKPQTMADVLAELAPSIDTRPLLLSIAAGVPLARIEGALPEG